MASPALEIPVDSLNAPRSAQADRSFGRRVFLATFLAGCCVGLVMLAAFALAVRSEVRPGVIGSLLPTLAVVAVLLALCLAACVSYALSRPLHQLIARLERSQASGRWEADFPENSTTRELNQLAAAINRAAVAVADSNERLDQAAVDFVEGMAQALDARDPCTAGHSQRVSDYASAIAITMGVSPGEVETIRLGARLHDIGKIGISDTVLRKPGNLTPEEYDIIKMHPQIGRRILERVAAFEPYLPLVELHHEDFDGHGYPYGLKGHEVPLAVRIVRVADVFDALTTDRSYRQAIPFDSACELIESRAGVKFDPDVVRALRTAVVSTELSFLGVSALKLFVVKYPQRHVLHSESV